MLAASRLIGMVSGDGELLTWMMLGMFSGMTTHGDACEEVAIRSSTVGSIPLQAEWIFCSGGGWSLWVCTVQVHLYQGWILDRFICGGHIPEW